MSIKLPTRLKWFLVILVILMLVNVGFFIITTRNSKPETMKLFLPKNEPTPTDEEKLSPSQLLTLIIANEENIYYYDGLLNSNSQLTHCRIKDLRTVIETYKKKITNGPVIMIKPAPNAQYKITVNVLDEMLINDIKRYAMAEISKTELKLLQNRTN